MGNSQTPDAGTPLDLPVTARFRGSRPDTTSLLIPFALGMATGLTLGLLIAPVSGRDARRHISSRAVTVRQRISRLPSRAEAMDIVRQQGVRGLLGALRSNDRVAADHDNDEPLWVG
jgi:hypothetical protein